MTNKTKRKPHKRKPYERKYYSKDFKQKVVKELKRRIKQEGLEIWAACVQVEKDSGIMANTIYGWLTAVGKNLHAFTKPYKFKKNEGVVRVEKVGPCNIPEHEVKLTKKTSKKLSKQQKEEKLKQPKKPKKPEVTKQFEAAADVEQETPITITKPAPKKPIPKKKCNIRIEITANGAIVSTPEKTIELREGAVMEFPTGGKITYEI